MTLTLIPSFIPCKTEQWDFKDGETECTFQVFNGLIEHVSNWEKFSWSRGMTLEQMKIRYEQQEAERLNSLKNFRLRFTERQKEAMLSEREYRKRIIEYTEGEMRNGEIEIWK